MALGRSSWTRSLYFLVDIYDDVVSSVGHIGDVWSSRALSLLGLCGQIAVDVARVASVRRKGPVSYWTVVLYIATSRSQLSHIRVRFRRQGYAIIT